MVLVSLLSIQYRNYGSDGNTDFKGFDIMIEKNKPTKIGLIQTDGIMPNVALMKMSAFYKSKGQDVHFIDLSTLGIKKWIASKIFVGGSGYDLRADLPKDIEEIVPDYKKFNKDYSIGFTSRGCIRNCDFCIVRSKEGSIHEVNMDWIKHTKAVIMDNNFLASPKWKEKLQYFINNNIKVNFNQGLDIRLINRENVKILFEVKAYDIKFKRRSYYFAFDDPKLESIIKEKIKLLVDIGFRSNWLFFYMICGFNTTHEEDIRRFNIIKDLGCVPYIMKFNDIKNDKWLNHFDRYVNGRFYQLIKLEDYKNGVLCDTDPPIMKKRKKRKWWQW